MLGMIPEFWLDEANDVVRQVNGYTAVEYHFASLNDAKKAKKIMFDYVDKWSRKKNKTPLYPETLVKECLKKGISVLHVQAGMR